VTNWSAILFEQAGYRHQKQDLPHPKRHAQKVDFEDFAGLGAVYLALNQPVKSSSLAHLAHFS
jgi:hypothetical protein